MIHVPAATYSALDRFGLFGLLGSRNAVTTWTGNASAADAVAVTPQPAPVRPADSVPVQATRAAVPGGR